MAKGSFSYKDFVRELSALTKPEAITSGPRLVIAFGPSDYLAQKVGQTLREKWVEQTGAHYSSIEAAKLDAESFSLLWESESIFEPKTFYLVRRVEKKADFPKLLEGIPKPQAIKNHLCLLVQGKALGAKLEKEAARLGAAIVPCFEPAEYELGRFIGGLARRHGLKLDDAAIALIRETQGADLFKLENEIVKLSLIFADDKDTHTANDLAPYLGMLREDHVFKLDNLLVAGRPAEAQALVVDLLRRGEKPLSVLAILASHCRKAYRVSLARQRGQSDRDIAQALRLPMPVVKGYTEYVARTKPARFTEALVQCREADRLLKSSRLDDELILSGVLATLAM